MDSKVGMKQEVLYVGKSLEVLQLSSFPYPPGSLAVAPSRIDKPTTSVRRTSIGVFFMMYSIIESKSKKKEIKKIPSII